MAAAPLLRPVQIEPSGQAGVPAIEQNAAQRLGDSARQVAPATQSLAFTQGSPIFPRPTVAHNAPEEDQ